MDTFTHIRMVLSIIMGLSIAHSLKGAARLIEHPKRYRPYWVHLLWAFYIFLLITHFWWWEFHLHEIGLWVFPKYFFVICYIITYYTACVLLFPDDLSDYKGFEDYFYSRKNWFFAVLAIIFGADTIDTLLKGKEYIHHLGWEYLVRTMSHLLLCLLAIKLNNKRFHAVLVIVFIVYEISWILRFYYR